MATWEDFSSKFGFDDGDGLQSIDEAARDRLVDILNEEFKGTDIIATSYDRPGLHNSCLILIKKGEEMVELPGSITSCIQELIDEAYDQVTYGI